jgi:hypothetical protein
LCAGDDSVGSFYPGTLLYCRRDFAAPAFRSGPFIVDRGESSDPCLSMLQAKHPHFPKVELGFSSSPTSRLLILRKVPAPVLRVAGFRRLRAERLFLPPARCTQMIGGNTQANEIFLHRIGAPLAESQVVLRRTALVAVAFDGDPDVRIALKEVSGLLQRLPRVRPNCSAPLQPVRGR